MTTTPEPLRPGYYLCMAPTVEGATFQPEVAYYNEHWGWTWGKKDPRTLGYTIHYLPDLLAAVAELYRLRSVINTPLLDDFMEAVRVEQAHQKEKWGADHDAQKTPGQWAMLFQYILGKQARAAFDGNWGKYRHHLITLAAIAFSAHTICSEVVATPQGEEKP